MLLRGPGRRPAPALSPGWLMLLDTGPVEVHLRVVEVVDLQVCEDGSEHQMVVRVEVHPDYPQTGRPDSAVERWLNANPGVRVCAKRSG